MADAIGFHCNACGKCCNSPPAMSLRELFRHRDRFIGSLAVGQVRRVPVGGRIVENEGGRRLDDEDAHALSALQDAIFHRSDVGRGSGQVVSLVTQAFDYPSSGRCPALADDGSCAIHLQDKPLMCRVVPLDPYLPDRLQDSVLLNRRSTAAYMGASCIGAAAEPPYRVLVRHGRVADPAFDDDLRRRRADLAEEKERWGRTVFALIEKELSQGNWSGLRDDADLVLPLVPLLAVLAAEGDAMRMQCVEYIDFQLALIDAAVNGALARKRVEDRAVTAQLRGFAQAYARQRALLIKPG
jgi:Fe-S-cluster containining protein